jgi:hypothetical protein
MGGCDAASESGPCRFAKGKRAARPSTFLKDAAVVLGEAATQLVRFLRAGAAFQWTFDLWGCRAAAAVAQWLERQRRPGFTSALHGRWRSHAVYWLAGVGCRGAEAWRQLDSSCGPRARLGTLTWRLLGAAALPLPAALAPLVSRPQRSPPSTAISPVPSCNPLCCAYAIAAVVSLCCSTAVTLPPIKYPLPAPAPPLPHPPQACCRRQQRPPSAAMHAHC